jgi:hypothetical protein
MNWKPDEVGHGVSERVHISRRAAMRFGEKRRHACISHGLERCPLNQLHSKDWQVCFLEL